MKKTALINGKILYALIFLLFIPSVLLFWARYTKSIIRFPAIESTNTGWTLIIGGSLLILLAMFTLKKYGKGLPMNAYPPPRFVNSGPYRLFQHPIYWGFGILMLGYFILTDSASGLWQVTPITILGMIALVLGYEEIDLKKRFPDKTIKTVLDLPEMKAESPGFRARFASLFWVVALLLLGNFITAKLAGNTPALLGKPLVTTLSIEIQYLPFLSVIFLIVTPFLLKRK
ncbi:MAG: hypothetical protein KAI99_22070, partial [Cyclobacteriaceae bacterium]|nr:hypothetical protein [Cyclobacteriaceae bacterium]